jgi:HEAT repeat protein
MLITNNAQLPGGNQWTDVFALIRQLKDHDPAKRANAIVLLGQSGENGTIAVPVLIEMLKDQPGFTSSENNYFRDAAAKALAQIGLSAVPALTEALKDEDVNVRAGVSYALGRIGPDAMSAVPQLINTLKNWPKASKLENDYVRDTAANALVNIGSAAVPKLIEALKMQNVDVRGGAAYALGRIGPRAKAAVPTLIEALKASHEYVRSSAADALGRIGPAAKPAVDALIEALRDGAGEVRSGAAYALGQLGDKKAIPVLINSLQDQHEHVRGSAASALVRIGPAATVDGLIEALKESHEGTRGGAAHVLGQFGPAARKAVPELIRTLNAQDEYVRDRAANALGRIGSEDAVPPLMEVLQNENDYVRGTAADALGRIGIGAKAAIPELTKSLNAKDDYLRSSAADALVNIAEALARARDRDAISQLRMAHHVAESSSDPDVRKQAELIGHSIAYLESLWQEEVRAWVVQHPEITVPVGLILILFLAYSVIFWLRPLWLLPIAEKLPRDIMPKWMELFVYAGVDKLAYRPRVLDAWIEKEIDHYRREFESLKVVSDRSIHVRVPVCLNDKTVHDLSCRDLRECFSQSKIRLLIHGEGGSGKLHIACQIARWAMANGNEERICSHDMLPVLIGRDELLAENDPEICAYNKLHYIVKAGISKKFFQELSRARRILVVVHQFSELSMEIRNRILPDRKDFSFHALIITSRIAEKTHSDVLKTRIETQRIKGGDPLSAFISRYLNKKRKDDLFPGKKHHDLCRNLCDVVGKRDVTVLIVKIYVEILISSHEANTLAKKDLPKNIPDLMLRYVDGLIRTEEGAPDPISIHDCLKVISWMYLKDSFRPIVALRTDIVKELSKLSNREQVDQTLGYLEKKLHLLESVKKSPGDDRVLMTLDPLAEYLAARHLVESYRNDDKKWYWFFEQAKQKSKDPAGIKDFLMAVQDCCRTIGIEEPYNVPPWVHTELAKLTGWEPDKQDDA